MNLFREVIATVKPDIDKLPGGWDLSKYGIISLRGNNQKAHVFVDTRKVKTITNVLSLLNCYYLIELMMCSPKVEPVNVHGTSLEECDSIGSNRTTIWSPHLAEQLWSRLSEFFDVEEFNQFSATDWWQGDITRTKWKPIGISPMLRFMQYSKGGQHYAHYDAGFIYPNDNYRTLKSVVIYLTTHPKGGSTRMVIDGQDNIPIWNRNHDDWVRPTSPDEIQFMNSPNYGSVLVFNHRECHDVEEHIDTKNRVIIRTDILYQAV